MNEKNKAAIYVHIPFCRQKCAYCDFASFPDRQGDMDFYVEKLLLEAQEAQRQYGSFSVPSIFIGGGTPSILEGRLIARILEELGRLFSVEEGAEISIEANPGTLAPGWLECVKNAGVNRISFGAQAFQEELLRLLGRIHSCREIEEAVEQARAVGFERINLDLMYALPGQTIEQWSESLDCALALGVGHVSCYSLILEEGTPLTRRIERGELAPAQEETVLAMQRMAAEKLQQGGLFRYEISNYARPGMECRHNLCYWRRGDYLGLGCAAHSLMRGERFCNADTLDGYLAGQIGLERERLTREDEIEEAVMLELRTVVGIAPDAFSARYGVDFERCFAKGIRVLCENGLARLEKGAFFLTPEGLDVQNAAVVELLR